MNLLTRWSSWDAARNVPRRVRAIGLLLISFLLSGCGAPTSVKIATLVNEREFYAARYNEACKVTPWPEWCVPQYKALADADKALKEAAAAYARGGKLPLQMKAAKKACKELGRH